MTITVNDLIKYLRDIYATKIFPDGKPIVRADAVKMLDNAEMSNL